MSGHASAFFYGLTIAAIVAMFMEEWVFVAIFMCTTTLMAMINEIHHKIIQEIQDSERTNRL